MVWILLPMTGCYWSFWAFSLNLSYPKQKHCTSNAVSDVFVSLHILLIKYASTWYYQCFPKIIVTFVNWLGFYLFHVWCWITAIVDWSLLIIMRILVNVILLKTKTLHKQCSHHILLIKYANTWYYQCFPKIIVTFVNRLGYYLFHVWVWIAAIVDWSLLIISGILVIFILPKTKKHRTSNAAITFYL
jgi:hypothetical protein